MIGTAVDAPGEAPSRPAIVPSRRRARFRNGAHRFLCFFTRHGDSVGVPVLRDSGTENLRVDIVSVGQRMLCAARCTATSELEHAVSIVMLGPRKSNAWEMRFASIVIIIPVAEWALNRYRLLQPWFCRS